MAYRCRGAERRSPGTASGAVYRVLRPGGKLAMLGSREGAADLLARRWLSSYANAVAAPAVHTGDHRMRRPLRVLRGAELAAALLSSGPAWVPRRTLRARRSPGISEAIEALLVFVEALEQELREVGVLALVPIDRKIQQPDADCGGGEHDHHQDAESPRRTLTHRDKPGGPPGCRPAPPQFP